MGIVLFMNETSVVPNVPGFVWRHFQAIDGFELFPNLELFSKD
jgi:hypothetical protein